MTITSIQEYDKKKVLIQLDGHLIFPLYKSETKTFRLQEGEEISQEAYEEIVKTLLPRRAKLRAMNLLLKRSYTREGLKRKLVEGKYPESIVTEALEYVESYGYINDDRYAEEYIRCYCETRSKRRIMQDLYAKGVDKETSECAWMRYEALNNPIDEVAQIKEVLRKKKYNPKSAERKESVRVMNYLYRKGYGMENIVYCMKCDDIFTNL